MLSFAAACLAWSCGDGIIGSTGADADEGTADADRHSDAPPPEECEPETCEDLGWACGKFETCGEIVDCADHGLTCSDGERCEGGIDGPTQCVDDPDGDCDVCHAIPDCSDADPTRLSGRVMTPGRDDGDTANQVGVPNAIVYILRTTDVGDLPDIEPGLPSGGTNCDRCEDQLELRGPVLNATVTDATGAWELEGNVPVDEEIILVVTAGKFRRAEAITVPEQGACSDTALSQSVGDNPTRLPRGMFEGDDDGLAVNIPRIAVTTGVIDAMECVFEKIGIDEAEFDNHPDFVTGDDNDARINLYQGQHENDDGDIVEGGMSIDGETPLDIDLYSDLGRLEEYDMLISDCKGQRWDDDFSDRDAYGDNVREYVNRGGRLFASHLSFSWLHENEDLGDAAVFSEDSVGTDADGTGEIALDRPQSGPQIESFRDWMVAEGVVQAPNYEFNIRHPRSQAQSLLPPAEEFVFCLGEECTHEHQQFSFDTPAGSSEDEACGRVAYSGFHVSPAQGDDIDDPSFPYKETVFPELCGDSLTDEEKVLLYSLFDLSSCIGDPVPPPTPCNPRTCEERCGFIPDGCGELLDCRCPIE